MTNINRGEHALTLAGETYTLVLTLDDLVVLENSLNVGAGELFDRLRLRTAWVSHVNAIVARAFAKATPRPPRKDINDLVGAVPYTDRYMAALMLMAGALNLLSEQQTEQEEGEEEQTKAGTDKEPGRAPLSTKGDSSGDA